MIPRFRALNIMNMDMGTTLDICCSDTDGLTIFVDKFTGMNVS